MKVNRKELLTILSGCKPGLSRKEIIEQSTHFVFLKEAVTTFNDQICIIYPYKSEFKFSVQGEEFYKALDSITDDEVELLLENDQLKINSKKTKAGLSTLIGEEARVETMITNLIANTNKPKFWKKLPADFINGIFLCMFTASKDMTKGVRCCVACNEGNIVSTDNVRISRYALDSKVEQMLIPARDAVELVKYNVTKYGLSDGWVHFKTDDGVMFNCRVMVGEYPYEKLLRFFRTSDESITLPKELQEVMKTAAVFASGDVDVSKMVEVRIRGQRIFCKSEKERGWIENTVDLEKPVSGEFHFYINPIFLAQILERSTDFFLIQGEEFPDKAVFTNDKFQHIIALPA